MYGFQHPGYGPMNWQNNNHWSGGSVNGQQMPLLPPPPFYYPFESSSWTEDPSVYNRKNQAWTPPSPQPLKNGNRNRGRSESARIPRRGILKSKGQWNTPTQRRLVHFMPEQWQEPEDGNTTLPEYRRPSGMKPDQMNNKGQKSTRQSAKEKERVPSNIPLGKAHTGTLSRRERRQTNRAVPPSHTSEGIGHLTDNRFNLLSETDEEEVTDNDHSEADEIVKTSAMKNSLSK